MYDPLCINNPNGGGVLPGKLGRGVRPASQNPYPIYDQSLQKLAFTFFKPQLFFPRK